MEHLLQSGHLALALLCARETTLPPQVLLRTARLYETKGWILLAARAYRAAGDIESAERISRALRADGRIHDAAEILGEDE